METMSKRAEGDRKRVATMIANGQYRTGCSVTLPSGDACDGKHKGRGMCDKHYRRFMKFGDPLYVGDNGSGKRKLSLDKVQKVLDEAGFKLVGEYVNNRTPVACVHTCGEHTLVHVGNLMGGRIKNPQRLCANPSCRVFQPRKTEREAVADMKRLGWTPVGKYTASNNAWEAVHDACGSTHSPALTNLLGAVKKGKTGCATCGREEARANRQISKEIRETAFAKANIKVLSAYKNAHTRLACECLTCGTTFKMAWSTFRDREYACVACNSRNGHYYKNLPTNVYLLKNSKANAIKVGISKDGRATQKRITHLKQSGFTLVKLWLCENGEDAYDVEQSVLKHWRDALGNPKDGYLPKEHFVDGAGYTETVSMRKAGIGNTVKMIDELVKIKK